jgi:hypothetical protein
MTLDMLDAAFVTRWRALAAPQPAPNSLVDQAACGEQAPGEEAVSEPIPRQKMPLAVPPDAPLAERLLRAAPEEWIGLAGHVERARLRGRRIIAVAGCERGEGRTTLVECLATALRARGCEVTCVGPADAAAADRGTPGGGVSHDKRIVLVDAGIWFPPGPVRRQRLMVASLGCEAVILVRRADRPSIGSQAALLAGFGVEVLGEVMTFTDSATKTPVNAAESPPSLMPASLRPTDGPLTRDTSACETRA